MEERERERVENIIRGTYLGVRLERSNTDGRSTIMYPIPIAAAGLILSNHYCFVQLFAGT